MIKIILGAFIVLFVTGLKAQDSDIQTLLSGDTRVSGFGGPFMSFTTVKGQFGHMMGGGGAVLLGDFFFGGHGEGLTTNIPVSGTRIDFGHGGFWTGYSFMAQRAIHPAISAQVGWGSVAEADYDTWAAPTDNVFVFNPGVEVELNFAPFFRPGIGAHYRLATGVNPEMHDSRFPNADLSGPGALLTFKFGWFYNTGYFTAIV